MTETAADSPATWLTKPDDSPNIVASKHSEFSGLPTELLENIVLYVPSKHLPALARISPVLRELVEKHLYHHINVNGLGWKRVIWPLYRTLVSRPDLANKVRIFECKARREEEQIEVDVSALSLHDQSLYSVAKVTLNQITIVGCIVLQRIGNVEKICLDLRSGYAGSHSDEPLGHFIPGYDRATAHTLHFAGLQKLTKLDFSGVEFHWALAKLPCLRWLRLSRPCEVLCDDAPNEVSTSLTRLEICARSDILRSASLPYRFLKEFLAHFPTLLELKLTIYDLGSHHLDGEDGEDEERSYDSLFERLGPVASHLRTLELGVFNNNEEGYVPTKDGNKWANRFLTDVVPASSFQGFTSLERLVVPYQCLVEHTTSPFDPHLLPDWIFFPATLKYLQIDCPQKHVYDHLAQMHTLRPRLPVLSKIKLYCQLPYGDEYPVIFYEHREHPALRILSDLGISLTWECRVGDWKPEWAEYDLEVPKVIEWIEGLGT